MTLRQGLRRRVFEDGDAHGTGSSMYAHGDVYDGDFEDGSRHGKGTLTFTNGDIYDGEVANDERRGGGKMPHAVSLMETCTTGSFAAARCM